MAEIPDLHKLTAAQTLRMLALHEAQLRQLAERVRAAGTSCSRRR